MVTAAGESDESGELRARVESLESRVAELERGRTAQVPQPPGGEPEPSASGISTDPTDPFVPPDWLYDEDKKWFTYYKEAEACPFCGIGSYLSEGVVNRSFRPNGFKDVKFKDIGPRRLVIGKHNYRCGVNLHNGHVRCLSSFQQEIPAELFHKEHRMTQRLYQHIIDMLEQPIIYGRIIKIAKEAGVSRKTIDRINDERLAQAGTITVHKA